MDIVLTLPDELSDEERVSLARDYLGALVQTNRVLIRHGLVPGNPYETDVIYAPEPADGREEFADALRVYTRGWGDCDDLAAWFAAGCLEQGIPVSLSFRARYRKAGLRVHCMVRMPNGSVEDPSKVMRP